MKKNENYFDVEDELLDVEALLQGLEIIAAAASEASAISLGNYDQLHRLSNMAIEKLKKIPTKGWLEKPVANIEMVEKKKAPSEAA